MVVVEYLEPSTDSPACMVLTRQEQDEALSDITRWRTQMKNRKRAALKFWGGNEKLVKKFGY